MKTLVVWNIEPPDVNSPRGRVGTTSKSSCKLLRESNVVGARLPSSGSSGYTAAYRKHGQPCYAQQGASSIHYGGVAPPPQHYTAEESSGSRTWDPTFREFDLFVTSLDANAAIRGCNDIPPAAPSVGDDTFIRETPPPSCPLKRPEVWKSHGELIRSLSLRVHHKHLLCYAPSGISRDHACSKCVSSRPNP